MQIKGRHTAEGFLLTLMLGPFVVGGPVPVWSVVADQVVAELKREWEARHAEGASLDRPEES